MENTDMENTDMENTDMCISQPKQKFIRILLKKKKNSTKLIKRSNENDTFKLVIGILMKNQFQ